MQLIECQVTLMESLQLASVWEVDVWSPVCAIWLSFVFFSCRHPVFSTVSSAVHAAFSGGLAVVTSYSLSAEL